jgi:hypothetical protein
MKGGTSLRSEGEISFLAFSSMNQSLVSAATMAWNRPAVAVFHRFPASLG